MDAEAPDILVIDDDPWIVELVIIAAEERNWTVISASDGPTALQLLSKERPRLMLLDVRLPQQSGWELLAELERQHPDHPPVIMMTADQVDGDGVQGRGAVAILRKPFSVQSFFDLMAKYLGTTPATAAPVG